MKAIPTNSQDEKEKAKVPSSTHSPPFLPQYYSQRAIIPSPATRFDVDGLVRGVRRTVGAGVAIAGYPLQR